LFAEDRNGFRFAGEIGDIRVASQPFSIAGYSNASAFSIRAQQIKLSLEVGRGTLERLIVS
jgi:hypothetical protein